MQHVDTVNHDLSFSCGVCGATFASNRALKIHEKRKHQIFEQKSVIYQCVITNQCPICSVVLADRSTAQHHVVAAIQKGRCHKHRNMLQYPILEPKNLQCPIALCAQKFQTLRQLQTHICLLHLPVSQSHRVDTEHGSLGVAEAHGL